jgi:hypothetical protein
LAFPVAASALLGQRRKLPATREQLRTFDSGFENGVPELHTNDSKLGSAVSEFDISDSADHAVAAGRHGGREVLCS